MGSVLIPGATPQLRIPWAESTEPGHYLVQIWITHDLDEQAYRFRNCVLGL